MKYFTKYIPVEGEIKEGDKFLANDRIFTFIGFDGAKSSVNTLELGYIFHSANNSAREWLAKHKKIKLLLCSRDIQVGDKVIGKLADIFNYEELEIVELYKDGAILGKISEKYVAPSSDFFKVIGEVSPEAVWVKEGDEFDEYEEWWFLKRTNRPFLKFKPEYVKDCEKANHGLDRKIKLKCSQCNTFH